MKIACITQVRDECDIIELFVRINSRIFDHIYIINNNSVDTTQLILDKLILEGLPITVSFDGDNTYNQDGIVSNYLHNVNSYGIYDWFMFLDADEFLDVTKEDLIEAFCKVSPNFTPKCMWRSWVPINLNYFDKNAPLYHCFNPLEKENHITYKAVIDSKKVPYVKINHGNHAWLKIDDNRTIPDYDCGIRINHFPVRSVDQITSKAVLNHYRQHIRKIVKTAKGQLKSLGPIRNFFQLSAIHNFLRSSKYIVTLDELRRFGVMYNVETTPGRKDPQIDSVIDGIRFGIEEDIIQYPELSKISLGIRFDAQMCMMQDVIDKQQKKLQDLGIIPKNEP